VSGVLNVHPTKKGFELVRYLTKMVTPPGGVVIDLFAGSGTGGAAARIDGFRWLGAELNDTDAEPFASIARARIHHVEGREFVPRESLRAAEPPKQRSLFTMGEASK
jgi:DNA modification methylase